MHFKYGSIIAFKFYDLCNTVHMTVTQFSALYYSHAFWNPVNSGLWSPHTLVLTHWALVGSLQLISS